MRYGGRTVVSLYQSCHQAPLGEGDQFGAQVVNFTDLMGETLGAQSVADQYSVIAGMDVAGMLAETRTYLKAKDVELEDNRFEENLDLLRSMAKYRRGLACFGR